MAKIIAKSCMESRRSWLVRLDPQPRGPPALQQEGAGPTLAAHSRHRASWFFPARERRELWKPRDKRLNPASLLASGNLVANASLLWARACLQGSLQARHSSKCLLRHLTDQGVRHREVV